MSGETVLVTQPTVLTIGHSTRALEPFIEMLRAHGVKHLADIPRGTRPGKMTSQRPSSKVAAAVVKRHVKGIGLEASEFAGHYLRSGLATPAAMAGASERAIMNQTSHRSVTMLRRYIRAGSLFRENAAAVLGL
jgi:integrase